MAFDVLVYLLRNEINGKVYVGQTRFLRLSKRWSPTLSHSTNLHLRAAIQKYGPQSFSRQILAECSTQAELDELERAWIALLNSADPTCGYNQALGGRHGSHLSEEVRARIAKSVRAVWESMPAAVKRRRAKKLKALWKDPVRKERMRKRNSRSMRLVWQRRSPDVRDELRRNMNQSRAGKPTGRPAWNRGRTLGSYSDEHRENIRKGVTLAWARRGQERDSAAINASEWQVLTMSTPSPRIETIFKELARESVAAVQQALDSLERGGNTEEARSKLREISRKLAQIECEYLGCGW